ncbi:MAG: hypothetical protein IH898_08840, partial [Planctomycetes bacterium]|nr:hypothetical protein [Planctomycetota bacterium]
MMERQEEARKTTPMLSSGQESQIAKRATNELMKCKRFFITVDPKLTGKLTPIKIMIDRLAALPKPKNEHELMRFQKAVDDFMKKSIQFAFEQQLDDPQQYVSHAFSHAINVARYGDGVLRDNPRLLDAFINKHQISRASADFLFQQISLLHDIGYPKQVADGFQKANHSVAGARILTNHMQEAIKDIF